MGPKNPILIIKAPTATPIQLLGSPVLRRRLGRAALCNHTFADVRWLCRAKGPCLNP